MHEHDIISSTDHDIIFSGDHFTPTFMDTFSIIYDLIVDVRICWHQRKHHSLKHFTSEFQNDFFFMFVACTFLLNIQQYTINNGTNHIKYSIYSTVHYQQWHKSHLNSLSYTLSAHKIYNHGSALANKNFNHCVEWIIVI